MKRLLVTVILLVTLSGPISAGQIPSDGSASPAPPPPTTAPAPGDTPSGGESEFSSEALSALLSVLSFLGV
jgi:hypothetical protein